MAHLPKLPLLVRAPARLQPRRGRRQQDDQGVLRAVSQREGQKDGLVARGSGPGEEDSPLESGQVSRERHFILGVILSTK